MSYRERKQARNSLGDSEFMQYWDIRKDENWTVLPGLRRRVKREFIFFCLVPQILINLDPGTTFNPYESWEAELKHEAEVAKALTEGETVGEKSKVTKVEKEKKKDVFINAAEKEKEAKKLFAEVVRIRNTRKEREPLLEKIREVKLPEARAILLVEILSVAYNKYSDSKALEDKKLIYETLWALDDVVLPGSPAPAVPPGEVKSCILLRDYGLVFDSLQRVDKLLASCRKIRSSETHQSLVALQLNEMSDSLPPLSKFTFGFKLDAWQKRVLRWIDAGRSVVICAPTSSGKTVLSAYVALIFKTEHQKEMRSRLLGVTAQPPAGPASGGPSGGPKAPKAPQEDLGEPEGEEDEDGEDNVNDFLDEEEEEDDNEGSGLPGTGDPDTVPNTENPGMKDPESVPKSVESLEEELRALVLADRVRREQFQASKNRMRDSSGMDKVLFVVPTEPLVWQVAAYFTKLLREEGDRESKVAIVTDQMTFFSPKRFDEMPQIVVGTPLALENALTKARGLVGLWETHGKAQRNLLPGGFEHFDWAIYDEVHALDGREGAALQRLIRCMNCKFLALSATVGNAEELRGWMERVKGDQLMGVEVIDAQLVANEVEGPMAFDPARVSTLPPTPPGPEEGPRLIQVVQTLHGGCSTIPVSPEAFETIVMDRLKGPPGPKKKADVSIAWSEEGLEAALTVGDLRRKVCELVAFADPQPVDHARHPVQLFFRGVELADDRVLLSETGLFAVNNASRIVYMKSLVNLLVHQSRFINLQRYVWDGAKRRLDPVNPLAVVESVEALSGGILANSSLSFTSKDSYRLWKVMKRMFPYEAIQNVDPINFFGENERITLQRTKDYEDLLKVELQRLAAQWPKETLELLCHFQMTDQKDKQFDLCEVILALKELDMLPCLPFHLNTFEAIKLFRQLLCGLEYRQKVAYPTYYSDLKKEKAVNKSAADKKKKDKGGNEKELEEAQKAGDIDTSADFTVDEFQPHPKFTFSKGQAVTETELSKLVEDMELFDGFEKRSKEDMRNNKGKNLSILKHALIRGLRRGIGLFINEVSFPSYRRAVQKLASKGKLAVVVSDDSLAFGVNMPFRTCVFCGEMNGELDELMAQQMSGRAGRRGLDTQGNIVYAGIRASFTRRLMIGKITNITGNPFKEFSAAPATKSSGSKADDAANMPPPPPGDALSIYPRYESMSLQMVLSPRHVGWNRAVCLGGKSLLEFRERPRTAPTVYSTEMSLRTMMQLGFIKRVQTAQGVQFVPCFESRISYATLSVMWHLRDRIFESITVGKLLGDIVTEFHPFVQKMSFLEKRVKAELLDPLVFNFFLIIVVLVDRTPYKAGQGAMSIFDVPYVATNPQRKATVEQWEQKFADMQASIPVELRGSLADPVVPGVLLDGTFLQCLLERSYIHLLGDELKQEMKKKLWRSGEVFKILCNCCWPEMEVEQQPMFQRVAFFIFRTAFLKLRYLNSELIRYVIDFDDVSAAEFEARTDSAAGIVKPALAQPWSDNDVYEATEMRPNTWATAVEYGLQRCSDVANMPVTPQHVTESFQALSVSDLALLVLLTNKEDAGRTRFDAASLLTVVRTLANVTLVSRTARYVDLLGSLMHCCM